MFSKILNHLFLKGDLFSHNWETLTPDFSFDGSLLPLLIFWIIEYIKEYLNHPFPPTPVLMSVSSSVAACAYVDSMGNKRTSMLYANSSRPGIVQLDPLQHDQLLLLPNPSSPQGWRGLSWEVRYTLMMFVLALERLWWWINKVGN